MRWLVTGAGGMLGHEVRAALARRDEPAAGLDRASLDITGPDAVREALARHCPDVVVNCAAYTAVDAAETDEARAARVNGDGPGLLAAACAERGARLIHVSTDYVFRGDTRAPYSEDHPVAPGTAYGRTKLAGERAVLAALPGAVVVRTAWLYGVHGRCFVRTMLERATAGDTVDVVADQHGQPTWAADVAGMIVALGRRPGVSGVFHATNAGATTWYAFAREVFRLAGADPGRVRPIGSGELTRSAPRPAYTVLGHARWAANGVAPPRHWRAALREAMPLFRSGQPGSSAGRRRAP